MTDNKNQKHFVFVHGSCHGAWCWYKVKPRLETAGHRVTVMDLTASGIDTGKVEEIQTLNDYAQPLFQILGSLGPTEQVILIGHSMGGPVIALAADMFRSKISVAVFIAAFMPDTKNPLSYAVEKVLGTISQEQWSDTKFGTFGPQDRPLSMVLLGPNCISNYMYQLSPIEDLELGKTLVRTGPVISTNLAGAKSLTEDGYGSVTRVYIVCGKDKTITEDSQKWMIENFPVEEMIEIKDSDHMPMFSKPQEVCDHLLKIAHKYA